jgi:hypothetical protein
MLKPEEAHEYYPAKSHLSSKLQDSIKKSLLLMETHIIPARCHPSPFFASENDIDCFDLPYKGKDN